MKTLTSIAALSGLSAMSAMAEETAAAAVSTTTPMLAPWEIIVFCIVVVGVIGLGIWKASDDSTNSENSEGGAADYFLAGRGLSWWLVGFSLIAANISTEQFVGMSGKAANWVGLAIAGYEWLAAITLVVVAFTFLPMLLKRGVFTIPQFLEERFDGKARSIMAVSNLIILVGVPTAGVIYAGAKVVSGYFDLSMMTSCIIIASSATVYVFVGGLKACAWTDLIWGAALIFGGGVVAVFALEALSAADPQALMHTASATSQVTAESLADSTAMERFFALNGGDPLTATNTIGGKLSMVRPNDDPELPWSALCLGLWIPNFFYWGLNQYIMQRTLASKSLAEGQKGIVFAAALKLLIPFVVIVPGILAYNLYHEDMKTSADLKVQAAITTAAANNSKTTLYNVTADYIYANIGSTDAQVPCGIELITQNVDKAGNPEHKQSLAEHKTALSTLAQVTDINGIDIYEKKYAFSIPESVTALDNHKRITADFISQAIAELNKGLIGEKEFDKQYTVTAALSGYDHDSAFAMLLRKLLPGTGWAWFVLAALFGAVVSSLASMLNSASTLFTLDIYNKFYGDKLSQTQLVRVGKISVIGCAAIALSLSIFLSTKLDSIFTYIQEFQGFMSPGALAVFLFGFFVAKCPRFFGWLGIAINVVQYGAIKYFYPDMPFLNRMAICFVTIVAIGFILTYINARLGAKPFVLQDKNIVEMESSKPAAIVGGFVVIATIALYIIFW